MKKYHSAQSLIEQEILPAVQHWLDDEEIAEVVDTLVVRDEQGYFLDPSKNFWEVVWSKL